MSGVKKIQQNYSFDILKNKNEIVFFMLGELGWESSRWSPPVNYFIKNNPDKKYIIATLADRVDLYKGYNDFYPIKIDGLYITKRPGMYYIYGMDDEYNEIIHTIQKTYPNAFIIKAPPNKLGLNVFAQSEMDFDFKPRQQNKLVIEKILTNHNNPVITLSPRHREDRDDVMKRNWSYWHKLYSMLTNFTVLVAGTGESYVKPKNFTNCICLEDYNTEDTSTIGLVIEGMRASRLTIGQQSGNPVLSLQLGTPIISWGHEKNRHQISENPQKTKCYFFECDSERYDDVKPEMIYQKILEELGIETKIIIGAANTKYNNWLPTNKELFNVTDPSYHWENVSNFLAEHVWEHLSEEDGYKASTNCFNFLKSSGRLRIAVPDGYKPDPNYIDWVKVGGGGKAGNDHKSLYNYQTLSKQLDSVGFKINLLEWYDENGQFHYQDWNSEEGHISRSMNHDHRNKENPLSYTSLILNPKVYKNLVVLL